MTVYRSIRAVIGASGNNLIDWDAVAEAAKGSTAPGDLDLSQGEREGYAKDVRDARNEIQRAAGITFDIPETVEIQNRHHWIDANIRTFQRVMEPLEERADSAVPGIARIVNTGSMSVTLSFLGRNVLGQYDPLLLADAPQNEHGLYFVRPNIKSAANELNVDYDRFRRWIAFHEVTHAAEFSLAPWLPDHLTSQMEKGLDGLTEGSLDREAFSEMQTTMTVVEGYAELLMDEAFDDEYKELREKLDQRRRNAGPISQLLRYLLGIEMKREQYEKGREFFDTVIEETDLQTATQVWESSENLPNKNEIENPSQWINRVAET